MLVFNVNPDKNSRRKWNLHHQCLQSYLWNAWRYNTAQRLRFLRSARLTIDRLLNCILEKVDRWVFRIEQQSSCSYHTTYFVAARTRLPTSVSFLDTVAYTYCHFHGIFVWLSIHFVSTSCLQVVYMRFSCTRRIFSEPLLSSELLLQIEYQTSNANKGFLFRLGFQLNSTTARSSLIATTYHFLCIWFWFFAQSFVSQNTSIVPPFLRAWEMKVCTSCCDGAWKMLTEPKFVNSNQRVLYLHFLYC